MPNLETTHLVGTAAEGDVEGRLVERFFRIVGTREDRQRGNEQRHVTRANLGKARDNGAIVGGLRAREVAQLLGNDRVALFLYVANDQAMSCAVNGVPSGISLPDAM
jgi:hypothetical protein